EMFTVVQNPNKPGDSLNVLFPAVDLPRTAAYAATGFEIVGGEFGGTGLPGLDAIELRTEDPVLPGNPDLCGQGRLPALGSSGGVGEARFGPPPATRVFDFPDLAVDPTSGTAPAGLNLFVLALPLPGETTPVTAIGGDTAPFDTLLGDSTY